MKYDNVELSMGGVTCDNPNCDWHDDNVKSEDYKDWVNRGCPKCGQVILTEQDLINSQQLEQTRDVINMYSPEELKQIENNAPELKEKIQKMMASFGIDPVTGPSCGPDGCAVIEFKSTQGEMRITDIKPSDGKV